MKLFKTNNLQKKLYKIQQQLKAPKNQNNDFGGYAYRSCEDILEAIKPLLNGCVLMIDDQIQETNGRIYVKATVTISHENKSYSVSAFAREPENRKGMDEAQITGATSSYARKYALNGLFCIDDTKDQDTMPLPEQKGNGVTKEEPKQEKPTEQNNQTDDEKEWLNQGTPKWNSCLKKGASVKTIREHFKLSKANAAQYEIELTALVKKEL